MKKIIILVLFLLITSLPLFSDVTSKQGTLDLVTFDFTKNNYIRLNGEWEFYWNRLISPEQFTDNTIKPVYPIQPTFWEDIKFENSNLPSDGCATYRLNIKLPENHPPLGLRLYELHTAYKLYINGNLIHSVGKVGDSKKDALPFWRPSVVPVEDINGTLEIVLQISNYHYIHGGFIQPIKLGDYTYLTKEREKNVQLLLFVIGAIFIMGLYHIGLYMLRRKDSAPLYFGIFCFLIAIRALCSGEYLVNDIFVYTPWILTHRLEYLSIVLAMPFIVIYFYKLFAEIFNEKLYRLIIIIYFAISLLIVVTPTKIYSYTSSFFEYFSVFVMLYVFYIVIRSLVKKLPGAGIFLIGTFFICLAGVNDILYDANILDTGYRIHIGLFIFIFSQAILLSMRFSRAYQENEILTREIKVKSDELEINNKNLVHINYELEVLKNNLEQKVRERTTELESTLIKLAEANESLKLLSNIDSLTGVYNRRFFDEIFDYQWKQSYRSKNNVALLMIDIDHFKNVNDTYGHMAGDECLRQVAMIIKRNVKRISDTLTRYGGEEFAVILPHTKIDGAIKFAERLRHEVETYPVKFDGQDIPVTISIGVASMIATDRTNNNLLIISADQALYEAKRAGRNRVCFFRDETFETGCFNINAEGKDIQ